MRIGVFLGGPSREREISFAGGETAYHDKLLFAPIPIFVDSLGSLIKLNYHLMHEREIRDFFPPQKQQTGDFIVYIESFPHLSAEPVSSETGIVISPSEFRDHFDFAFLAMHGCEDGAIPGLLEWQPGTSRKQIPVDISLEKNLEIQEVISSVFERLGINVCVQIDGFLTAEGTILLHDPNTIPGMSPISFIFKQMAEIGLNVTQPLTYLIRQSIRERIRTGKDIWRLRSLLAELDENITAVKNKIKQNL